MCVCVGGAAEACPRLLLEGGRDETPVVWSPGGGPGVPACRPPRGGGAAEVTLDVSSGPHGNLTSLTLHPNLCLKFFQTIDYLKRKKHVVLMDISATETGNKL